MRTLITRGLVLALLIGPWVQELASFQRLVLQKPKPTIPTTSEATSLGEGRSVRFDKKREVYIFSYTHYDGKMREVYYELPTKAEIVVEASVQRSESGDGFMYQYAVHNLPTSRQGANTLIVRPPAEVTNPTAPDEGWRITLYPNVGHPDWKGIRWGDVKQREGIPPPPVTYAKSGREVELAMRSKSPPQALWHSVGVPPGKKQEGFSFESDRLPGIVPCYATGARFTVISPGWIPSRLIHENSLRFLEGKTVGPVFESPPKDPARVMTRMQQWLAEAHELGWVNNPEVAAQLSSMLEAARGYWQDGNETGARQELAKISAVAEEERETGITSELYAILKFNGEALLSSIDLSSGK